MLLLLQRCWYNTSVLLFYMARGTLSHVEVMTPLSTIIVMRRTPYTPFTLYTRT